MTTSPPVRAFVDPVHGFAGAPLEFDRADCRTLADIIAMVPLANEALRPLLRVKLGNAVIVDPSLYHRVLPKIDAWVTVVLPVHGGDNNLLGTIAAVALIGASIFVSAGMATPFLGAAFASGTLGANLLAAGLSLGASLLLQGLNAPKPAEAKAPDEIGSASAQNGFEPGAYLPRVLGRRRIAPPHAMPPYTENDGKDQIVTAVYALAGPHALSDIRIGDSDIAGAADVTYEIREGFATDAPLTLVTKTVIEKQVGVLLSEFKTKTDTSDGNVVDTAAAVFNPYWHKVETQKGPDLARLMFTLPQGIGNTSSSSSYPTWTSMRLRIRKKGAGSWVNLPEFLIKGRQPGQPLRIELDIKWLAAGSMPSSSTGFPSVSGTLGHRGWAQKFNRWPTTGTAKWAADTYFTSTYPHAVSYISGSRIEVSLDTTTFAQDAPYEIEMIRGFPGLTTAINFTNATYDNHDDFYTSRLSSGNQIIPLDPAERPSTIQLTALQSIWDEYPFDLTGQPTTLLAIRARNRNIDSVTCLAEGYAPDWDGSSWVADQKPRNPAAWYREVLRGDLNAEPVPDSLIDMANLVDWHEWCDTAGIEVNAIVEGQPVSEALGLIAQAGLARPRYGVRHGVVIDRPRDMVGLVTLRNAAGFSFEKPFGRMPHALKVQLADETNDFKLREVVVYADGYAAVDGIGGILEATRFESVSYPGITDETQASARALRDLRFGRHRSRLIQFTLDFEHLEFGIGDLVGLQVDILGQMGGQGRVVEVLYDGGNVAGLVLDEERDFTAADAASADRGALIRLADGTLLSKEVTADDTDLTTVMFATPFAMPTGPGGDLITAGALVATGTLDHETRPVLIWDLAPGPDLTCRVVAIDYAEDQIYAEPWVPPVPATLFNLLDDLGLTTGLKLALDAGDAASYPGTGQVWSDTSGGGHNFNRGSGSGSDAADPTFTGTAGSISAGEYFGFDGGDRFTLATSNPSWIENVHKTGAKFAFACWVYLGNTSLQALFGDLNNNLSLGIGFAGMVRGSGDGNTLRLRVRGGSGTAMEMTSSFAVGSGGWVMLSGFIDEAAGAGGAGLGKNDTFETFTSTYSSPSASAASVTFTLGACGTNEPIEAGGRMAMAAMWEGTIPTQSQLIDLYEATKGRFGL